MIRKIIFLVFILYTLLWFFGIYFLKHKTKLLLDNISSDNLKISYQELQISGFPWSWQLIIHKPKIQFIDHISARVLSLDKIYCTFNISMQQVLLSAPSHNFKYIQSINEQQYTWKIFTENDALRATLKFTKPLYFDLSIKQILTMVESFALVHKSLSIISENSSKLIVDNLKLSLTKGKDTIDNTNNDVVSLELQAECNNHNNTKHNKIIILGNIKLHFVSNNNRLIEVKHLSLAFDAASIELYGALDFVYNNRPKGKLMIHIHNYQNIINTAVLSNDIHQLLASKLRTQQILREEKTNNDMRFNIIFSDHGINIVQ